MTGPRLLLALLILAHTALDFVIWRLSEHQVVGSPPQILLIALLRSQLSLLALFLALGTVVWWVRLATVASGVAGWSLGFWCYAQFDPVQTATLFTTLLIPVLLCGVVARWRGFCWGSQAQMLTAGQLQARQFSLGAAFRWLTITAVLLVLAKRADFPLEYTDLWIRVGIVNTILAGLILWSFVPTGDRLPRLAALCFFVPGMTLLFQGNPQEAWITKFLLQAVLMAGSALILELAGWKLSREGFASQSSIPTKRVASNSTPDPDPFGSVIKYQPDVPG